MEDDKPDLKIVHSSDTIDTEVDKVAEDSATIIRNLTRKFSTLPSDQAKVMWASKLTDSIEEAIEKSGFSSEEFHRLFKEANAALYPPNQSPDFNIGDVQPDNPSNTQKPAETQEKQDSNVIPFPEPPENQE